MTDLRDPHGFEDVWRQMDPIRRHAKDHLDAQAVRAHLRRLVSRAPRALVTNYGAPKTIKAVRAHLDYISRKGELALIGREGQRLSGVEEIQRRADDWSMDQLRYRGGVALAYTMTLSMPPGTPAAPLERAARAFAAHEYGAHDFLTVLHQDRPHPHVHLAVRGEDDNGSSRPTTPSDLYRFPQVFAEKLQAEGIEADASPRWQRGVVLRPEHPSVRRAREKYMAGKAPPPRILVEDHREALAIARGLDHKPRPWEAQVAERQRSVRQSYLSLADRLDAMDEVGDRALASALRNFVAEMPPVRTRRELMVEQARNYDQHRARQHPRDPERDGPAISR